MDERIDKGNILIQWHFPEFKKQEKSMLWYIVMFAIAFILLIIAVVSSNFLFAVIIVMTVVIVLMHDRKSPAELEIKIMETGLQIGEKFFQYRDLNNFFIIYEPPMVSNLFIRPNNKLTPTMNVPLLDQNPLKIRDILISFMKEDIDAEEEPTSDFLSRILKI